MHTMAKLVNEKLVMNGRTKILENIEHFFKNTIREYFSSNLYRSLAISKFTMLEGKAIFIIIKENFEKLLTYIESIDLWLFLRFLAFENS